MSIERRARVLRTGLLSLLSLTGSGCRDVPEMDTQERRPSVESAPTGGDRARTIQVRNACPEQVELAIAATEPGPSTPTMTLGSTKVTTLTVQQGERIWLRHGDRFDVDRSVVPTGPVEVGPQCNGIYPRNGGR